MNKSKLWNKRIIINGISLGFMILGIGCISWAVSNTWVQPIGKSITPLEISQMKTNLHGSEKIPFEHTTQGVKVETNTSLALPIPEKNLYPVYPSEGDVIGTLTIPALNKELTIIQGTSEKELNNGVGHFVQSVLPGQEDNCVLSGHRDTVFTKLYELKIGDLLIVQTSAGIFTYEVNETRIVHADDKTVIVPTDKAVLTMTTCYPFYTIGYSPDRYIVSAALVSSK